MRIRVNQLLGLAALWAALIAMPLSIANAEDPDPGASPQGQDDAAAAGASTSTPLSDRWIFSLAAMSGVHVQQQEAAVSSTCQRGGPVGTRPNGTARPACTDPSLNQPGPLRPSDDSHRTGVTPFVGGTFQVMTPTVDVVPGKPRFFAAAEFMALFAADRRIAKEGNPASIDIPEDSPMGPIGVPVEALTGQGSATNAELGNWGYGAHAGVAFPVQAGKRSLWIKPSIGWLQWDVDVRGRVSWGNKIEDDAEIREVYLRSNKNRTLNAIGPGLEVEMETGRYGPVGSSLFMRGYGYKLLSKRRVDMSDEVQCPACPDAVDGFGPDTYNARWSWKSEPWVYRFGVGLRLHWLGKD